MSHSVRIPDEFYSQTSSSVIEASDQGGGGNPVVQGSTN